jgi:plastocyanin
MRKTLVAIVTALATLAFALDATAAAPKTLTGTVGPGYTIKLSKQSVPAGTYKLTVHDLAAIHDFHLTGPGVNKTTSVAGTGTVVWTVILKKGTYTYVCDPHRSFMVGKLKVT